LRPSPTEVKQSNLSLFAPSLLEDSYVTIRPCVPLLSRRVISVG